MYLSCKRH